MTMITACLAWYAEAPAVLERCACSLGGVCDRLVALGGRWEGFPEIPGDDVDAQVAALEAGCRRAGVFLDASWARDPWPSQVAKRAELMLTARGWQPDWLFVIDADEYIADANTDAIHTALETTLADAATIHGIRVPHKLSVRRPWRRMYRANTGVTVEIAHNGYRAADGRWLYGDPAHVQLEPAVDLTAHLLLVHDQAARDSARLAARQAYLQARRAEASEAWPTTAAVA